MVILIVVWSVSDVHVVSKFYTFFSRLKMALEAGYFLLIEVISIFCKNGCRDSHSRIIIPPR